MARNKKAKHAKAEHAEQQWQSEHELIANQLMEIAQHKDPVAVAKRNHAAQNAKHTDVLLAQPYAFGDVTLRNRMVLPPMCMYSVYAQDGRPTNFHYQHYVSRAYGGFGMVIMESTAVSPEGRISPCDLGLWDDSQIDAYRWIVDGIKEAGAVPAIQLNHAGRKASSGCPYLGIPSHSYVPKDRGGWDIVGPSAIAVNADMPVPRELTVDDIHRIVNDFREAARRAVECGFQSIQIHAAHGYLLSQFLDPLTNIRNDEYGGPFENRIRLLVEVVDAVRSVIPEQMPLMVRVSATDWSQTTAGWRAMSKSLPLDELRETQAGTQQSKSAHKKQMSEEEHEYTKAVKKMLPVGELAAEQSGGWDDDQTVELVKVLKMHGVDLIDVSTGGVVEDMVMPITPNYQVPYSRRIHQEVQIPTSAVGLITKPKQAEKLLKHDDCTLVEIGRAALREPYWPIKALYKLGVPADSMPYPTQYVRGSY